MASTPHAKTILRFFEILLDFCFPIFAKSCYILLHLFYVQKACLIITCAIRWLDKSTAVELRRISRLPPVCSLLALCHLVPSPEASTQGWKCTLGNPRWPIE